MLNPYEIQSIFLDFVICCYYFLYIVISCYFLLLRSKNCYFKLLQNILTNQKIQAKFITKKQAKQILQSSFLNLFQHLINSQ